MKKETNYIWVNNYFVNNFATLVMDYAQFGEVLKWDSKKLVFRPYDSTKTLLCEQEIKKILR